MSHITIPPMPSLDIELPVFGEVISPGLPARSPLPRQLPQEINLVSEDVIIGCAPRLEEGLEAQDLPDGAR